AQYGFAVFEDVPCKPDARPEVIFVKTIKRLLFQTHKAASIRLGTVWQEIGPLTVPLSKRNREIPANTLFQCKVGLNLPTVLHIKTHRLLENVSVCDPKRASAVLRHPQQQFVQCRDGIVLRYTGKLGITS